MEVVSCSLHPNSNSFGTWTYGPHGPFLSPHSTRSTMYCSLRCDGHMCFGLVFSDQNISIIQYLPPFIVLFTIYRRLACLSLLSLSLCLPENTLLPRTTSHLNPLHLAMPFDNCTSKSVASPLLSQIHKYGLPANQPPHRHGNTPPRVRV